MTFVAVMLLAVSANANVLWEEIFDRTGTYYIDKTEDGYWPYASQWFTGYTGTKGEVAGSRYSFDYTNVDSYGVTIRGRRLNGDDKNTIGLYFSADKAEDKDYVLFEGEIVASTREKHYLVFGICSPEYDGGDLNTMVVKVNGNAVTVPATTLGAYRTTSTVSIELPNEAVSSLYFAFDNVPSQKFITHPRIIGSEWNVDLQSMPSNGGTVQYSKEKELIQAIPNDGYHFQQWSDGEISNPRKIEVVSDTSFTAEFAKNIYTISTQAEHGSVTGGGDYEYLTSVQLIAIADEHYHFVRWSDGNTNNPRQITVEGDNTYTAIFSIDQHTISAFAEHGRVIGIGSYDYGAKVTLTVIPDFGFKFSTWNDGNTDNPRSIVVTQDLTFTAQMDIAQSGQCGDNLTWKYSEGILGISGTGAMYDYTQETVPWMLFFKESISSIVIGNGCTSIGNNAFNNLSNKSLKEITLPNSVETIGKYAFANCSYLKTITLGSKLEDIDEYAFQNDERLLYVNCYAEEPPILQENAFENYDIYLQVPCDALDEYKVAKGWKLFNKGNVSCIGAEETPVTTDDVTVVPTDDRATFTWPQNDQAAGYSIEITKDGVVFCTLKFNAQGQLTGIAFAPSRDSAREMASATMTANGWQFTVTGLNQGSNYAYTLDVTNAQQQSIKHYEGKFTTTGGMPTDVQLTVENTQTKIDKFLHNGQVLIQKNNKTFTILGQEVR